MIEKLSVDRVRWEKVEIVYRCPYCKGSTIRFEARGEEAFSQWNGSECKKCGATSVIDGVSVTLIKDNGQGKPRGLSEASAQSI